MDQPSLNQISESVRACTKCQLAKSRTHAVPGEGPANASILFVGEGPGYNEDQQGRPFVGQAGKLLDQLIATMGMKRSDVFITNVVKCRPPSNRDPMPDEIAACKPWLDAQIAVMKPKLIVTLGRHSMARFLPGETITKAHGKVRTVNGQLIYPVHHPAAALYQQSLRQTLEEDFKKIPQVLKQTEPAPEPPPKPKQLGFF